ncbi:hypothetical protein E2C01_098389 [Portunus trituberculatus]|uniref:Uncharacterized protein n=1 Tax=Portunus trituberculatus TaxID=210409 RepID=A0A5B7KE28_PORTR|nr:hypothetical protein [Portunus trituberculatus]
MALLEVQKKEEGQEEEEKKEEKEEEQEEEEEDYEVQHKLTQSQAASPTLPSDAFPHYNT